MVYSQTKAAMSLKNILRSLSKDRLFTFLNIAGLSLGLACIIVIVFIIQDDLSYDRFHSKSKNIYRLLAADVYKANPTITSANTPFPYGPALKENFSAVEEAVRFRQAYRAVVSNGEKTYKETDFYYVDPEVFSMFDFKMKQGDPRTALQEPNTVVLTQKTAMRIFGTTDVIGKTIGYNGSGGTKDLKITGILADLPSTTHFSFDYLASMKSLDLRNALWTQWPSLWTYILLKDGQDPSVLNKEFTKYLSDNVPQNENLEADRMIMAQLEPLLGIQLHSQLDVQMKPTSNINFLFSIAGIATLIFAMICFNFISLSTARALKKVKEVSIRKIVGARRRQLIGLFLLESLVLCSAGVFLALVFLESFAGEISTLTGRNFNLDITLSTVITLLLGIVLVTLVAGAYPAFFLSSFNPKGMLQSVRLRSSSSGISLRKSLVVVQFSIASLMIFGSLLIREQVQFIRSKSLGADITQIVYVPAIGKSEAFTNELTAHENIVAVTSSSRMPANEDTFDTRPVVAEGSTKVRDMESFAIDENFLSTYNIDLIAGTNLVKSADTVNAKFLINEEAVKYLGWSSPEEALGKKFAWQQGYVTGTVVGVTKDFHLASLHAKIGPLVMLYAPYPGFYEFTSIKLKANENLPETLALIETLWRKYDPAGGFELHFANDRFIKLHEADIRLGELSNLFSFIAIVIAALGLLGLTSYIVEEKTKELAIRKTLGATFINLVKLLYGMFMRPVVIGALLATPAMAFLANNWLRSFSYHTSIDWTFYIAAIALSVALAAITISYKSIRAVFENPVKSLRNE
jgi:putative ABC transport system permease protein